MSLSRNSVHTLGEYYQLLLKNGLLADTQPLKADFARTVPLVSCDSRVVVPGALFICKGAAFREEYLLTAVKLGAAAYVSERPYPGVSAPCIAVTDIRAAMALLADLFWNHPSGKVDVIGITGTKGKTTTAFFLKAILDRWQESRGWAPPLCSPPSWWTTAWSGGRPPSPPLSPWTCSAISPTPLSPAS